METFDVGDPDDPLSSDTDSSALLKPYLKQNQLQYTDITVFGSFFKRVLDSGEFADLHVTCGSKLFLLHSVVCFSCCTAIRNCYEMQLRCAEKVCRFL